MGTAVYVDGTIRSEEEACVSVFDRGFLYGDSVFETMRTSMGRPVDLGPHLDRIESSAHSIALTLPPRALLVSALRSCLDAAANEESYVRLVVTRGVGNFGIDMELAEEASLIVIARPLVLPRQELYREGARIAVVGVQKTPKRAMDPGVKSGNYLNSIMAVAEARKAKAHEAVMCDREGRVAEGATSNLFLVRRGTVETPPIEVGLLPGITRGRVIDLCASAGIAVLEKHLWPDDLLAADELFLTSSVRGVLPVGEIGRRAISAPCPGPITSRVAELYARFLEEQGVADVYSPYG